MKKGFIFLFALAMCAFVFQGNAQAFKFAHINSSELISVMPEADSANKKIEAYAKEMGDLYDELLVEYNKELDDYKTKVAANAWSDAVKSSKEKKLTDMQRRLGEQQQEFQQGIQKLQQDQFALINERIKAAIGRVAKANGYTYVFDVATLLYFNETQSTDIMPLVKKELKLK